MRYESYIAAAEKSAAIYYTNQMIRLLLGENDYELTKKVAQLKAGFNGTVERYDGANLSREQLADIFAGQTLFAVERLIVIDSPSANPDLWSGIEEWAGRLGEGTDVILVEPKPDKRTSAYKWLKKHADVQEFAAYGDRDYKAIESWLSDYAAHHGVKLTGQQLRRLVDRAGHDQWVLAEAVDKLSLLDAVTDEWIDDIVQASPSENVFALFETVLNGDTRRLLDMLATLRLHEDAYRMFGLINSQALQLVAFVYGEGDAAQVASDIGAKSAYPLQKLAPYARRIDRRQAAEMIRLLAGADMRIKSSDADPWLVLENTLSRVASL